MQNLKEMELRFAFAVNQANQFEKKHFGDAYKYLVYTIVAGKMILLSEEINEFRSIDEEIEHGSKRKGNSIIKFLKEKKVNVLVSTRFGKNIKLVNEYFIPVKVPLKDLQEIIPILNKYLHWIEDEWINNTSDFNLFTISSGIMKTGVKK